jgi:hypothetical protein
VKEAQKIKILLVTPSILAAFLFMVITINGYYGEERFDPIDFYFHRKLDFLIAFGLLIAGQITAFYHFASESERKIAGKWNIRFEPIIWKGKDQRTEPTRVIGKGTMYLVRSFYSNARFNGCMYVEFLVEERILAHFGIYEIELTLEGRKVTGESLMLSGKRIRGDLLGPSDTPGVNPCDYRLNYSEEESKLDGEAEMQLGNTKSRFVATRF